MLSSGSVSADTVRHAQWLLPQYQEDWFLARAVVRYRRFLHLQTLYRTLLLEPPLDVALICLAHQVCVANLGEPSHQLSTDGRYCLSHPAFVGSTRHEIPVSAARGI